MTAESQLATIDRRISALLDRMEDGDETPELSVRLSQRRAEKRTLIRRVEELRRKSQIRGSAPTAKWIEESLQNLGAALHGAVPAANEALKTLVAGSIVVQEIREEGRQRHHLRGRLRIHCGSMQAAMGGSVEERTQDNGNPPELVKEIIIDFVEPDELTVKANQAKELYDQGLMCAEIAKQLGYARSYVTKLLTHWHVSRDLPVPDGRARRSQLKRKHLSPPKYQEIANEVKRLTEEGRLFGEIAQKLGLDRNTVTKAWVHWHESRDLPVPDGRTRRKSLDRKSAHSSEEPPLTGPDLHTP
jgi:DNA-binding CsgD family transcriptional regulator